MGHLRFRPLGDGKFTALNQYSDAIATVYPLTRIVNRLQPLTLDQERRIDAFVTAETLRAKLDELTPVPETTASRKASARSLASKQTYSVNEVAALTGWSRQTVTRVFEQEKGTIILERAETLHKRKFRTITIPRAVYERVVRQMSV